MKNILMEVKGCELGVLVLSEDFFVNSQNPMLELEALTEGRVRLLPLFYKIDVDTFNKRRFENVWEERWKEWPKMNEERIQRWKDALDLVNKFSGLEFSKLATDELDYIHHIVKEVTRLVRPIQFSEEGLFGMDRLCKIVDHMYIECASKRSSHRCTQVAISPSARAGHVGDSGDTLDLVGIYGFAGLGKSTLCRSLCNFYSADFNGKVCWIDLGRTPSSPYSGQPYASNAFLNRMRHILRMVTGNNVDAADFFQVQNLFRNQTSFRGNPIFLAIDNILPDQDSVEEVDFYLSCKFPKGSKIFITARSKITFDRVIEETTKFSVVVEHIPELVPEEAMDIFLNEMPNLKTLNDVEDEVRECVNMCVINGERYHPLMLKSLAAFQKWEYGSRSGGVDWKRKLREVLTSAVHVNENDAWEMGFRLLDISYAALKEKYAQEVFIDLALFYRVVKKVSLYNRDSVHAWIRSVHSHHLRDKEIHRILMYLDELSFISYTSNGDDLGGYLEMHDLILDFAMYKQSQGSAHYKNLVLENSADWRRDPALISFLQYPASSSSPKSSRTVSISGCGPAAGSSADEGTLDLRDCQGVEILHLVNNPGVQEVLVSSTTLAHLRSFIVKVSPDECGRTSLRFTIDEFWPTSSTGATRMPGEQLVWLEISGNVFFTIYQNQRQYWPLDGDPRALVSRQTGLRRRHSENLAGLSWTRFRNLQKLALSHFPAHKIVDVTSCTSLRDLHLESMPGLMDVPGLRRLTNLDKLEISGCDKLEVLHIPVNVSSSIHIADCQSLKSIFLYTSPAYTEADRDTWTWPNIAIRDCKELRNVDGPPAATSKRYDQSNRRQSSTFREFGWHVLFWIMATLLKFAEA